MYIHMLNKYQGQTMYLQGSQVICSTNLIQRLHFYFYPLDLHNSCHTHQVRTLNRMPLTTALYFKYTAHICINSYLITVNTANAHYATNY